MHNYPKPLCAHEINDHTHTHTHTVAQLGPWRIHITITLYFRAFMAKTRAADSEEMKPRASGTQLRTCWRTKQPST